MEFNATFLVSIVSFLIFVFVMNKIFYKPLTKIVNEREKILEENFNEAKVLNDYADKILEDREQKLNEAEQESRNIISEKIQQYNLQSKEKIIEVSKKSAEIINEKKVAMEQEMESAKIELNTEVWGLAEQISSKVLGFKVVIEKNNKLSRIK